MCSSVTSLACLLNIHVGPCISGFLLSMGSLLKALHPMVSDTTGHLAEDHGLAFIDEHALGDLDLQIQVFIGKVAEEDVQSFLLPA